MAECTKANACSEIVSTLFDYLQIAWTGDLLCLKQFVNDILKLEGQKTIYHWYQLYQLAEKQKRSEI